jgi:hypothetical protein
VKRIVEGIATSPYYAVSASPVVASGPQTSASASDRRHSPTMLHDTPALEGVPQSQPATTRTHFRITKQNDEPRQHRQGSQEARLDEPQSLGDANAVETLMDVTVSKALALPAFPGSSRNPSPNQHCSSADYIDTENVFKGKILAVVARQVMIWLLETQHEFDPSFYRMQRNTSGIYSFDLSPQQRWLQDITTRCVPEVANRLSLFESYERAMANLSATLVGDSVSLEWFLIQLTQENLYLARQNYSGWEPPPSDAEWDVEVLLLTELSESFHRALAAYGRFGRRENVLSAAVEVCRMATSHDSISHRNATQVRGAQEQLQGHARRGSNLGP